MVCTLVYKIPYRRAWPSASREQRYLAYNLFTDSFSSVLLFVSALSVECPIRLSAVEGIYVAVVARLLAPFRPRMKDRTRGGEKGGGDGGSGTVWGASIEVGGEASREDIVVGIIGRV